MHQRWHRSGTRFSPIALPAISATVFTSPLRRNGDDKELTWIRGKATSYQVQILGNLHRLHVPLQSICSHMVMWLIWDGFSSIWAVLPKHTWQLCLCVGRKKFHPACFNSIRTKWRKRWLGWNSRRWACYGNSNPIVTQLVVPVSYTSELLFVSTVNKE